MGTSTIRIPDATLASLRELAREQDRPIGRVVVDAVDRYAREQFLAGLNEDYARLRGEPGAWSDWQAELAGLDGTLLDGLADDRWEE